MTENSEVSVTGSVTGSDDVARSAGPGPALPAGAPPQDRYLYKPFFGSSHSWALSLCETFPKGGAVLDVGSGSGAMGRELRRIGFSDLTAVETDPAARDHVRTIYDLVVADLDSLGGRRFDLVLLLDVLEHLTDPGGFLGLVAGRLAPGAHVLVSVPNVAHWSIRSMLLAGRFDYTERGILDKTHYTHFTLRSLSRLLADVPGLRTASHGASIAPLEFLVPAAFAGSGPFRAFAKIRQAGADAFPGLLAYQHLVHAVYDGGARPGDPTCSA